jgi:DNA mismatch repair protein MutL
VKELLENAVDAGASKITVEIRDGGMTFLRVTDDGCGMAPEDAKTAFLRHATSKLHTAEDLAAISTMGFRGEALAAIASVSRIDLMTKTPGAIIGTSLHLEAGVITEESEVGCPVGTTIIVRDLFFNTPARMKFMKSDSYEGSRVAAAVQLQALAHPDVAITLIRDGKHFLDWEFARHACALDVRVHTDFISAFAAEHFIHGAAVIFALDIPHGLLNAADSGEHQRAAAVKSAAVQCLHVVLDHHWILSDEVFLKFADHGFH